MTIRTRKFFGTVALLALVVVWSLLGMTIAQTPWLANSGLLQAIFYVVAGLRWGLPAMPILTWVARPDPAAQSIIRSDLSETIILSGFFSTPILYAKREAHRLQKL